VKSSLVSSVTCGASGAALVLWCGLVSYGLPGAEMGLVHICSCPAEGGIECFSSASKRISILFSTAVVRAAASGAGGVRAGEKANDDDGICVGLLSGPFPIVASGVRGFFLGRGVGEGEGEGSTWVV